MVVQVAAVQLLVTRVKILKKFGRRRDKNKTSCCNELQQLAVNCFKFTSYKIHLWDLLRQ